MPKDTSRKLINTTVLEYVQHVNNYCHINYNFTNLGTNHAELQGSYIESWNRDLSQERLFPTEIKIWANCQFASTLCFHNIHLETNELLFWSTIDLESVHLVAPTEWGPNLFSILIFLYPLVINSSSCRQGDHWLNFLRCYEYPKKINKEK